MKFSAFYLAGLTSAAETDDTAIISLHNLEKISLEFFSAESINKRSQWKERWAGKIKTNTNRMRGSFRRCGTINVEANEEIQMEYDISNPCGAIKVLMDGFSNWADRYIASCKGQMIKSHQKRRMEKWTNMLNKGNRFQLISIRIYYL